jgi:hypothetical protein
LLRPALENTISESFVASLKPDLVSRAWFSQSTGSEESDLRVFGSLLPHARRLHSSFGYRSPVTFEEDRMGEASAA